MKKGSKRCENSESEAGKACVCWGIEVRVAASRCVCVCVYSHTD